MTEATPLALITGGCRRVGAIIAAHLAETGWALALHGNTNAQPNEHLQGVLDRQNSDWHGFQADLSDAANCGSLIKNCIEHFGRTPDLLVNNASIFEYDDVDSLSPECLFRHFAINTHAPVLLAKKLVDSSAASQQPSIVHIIDQRVRNPNGDQLSYTLSKQALSESIRTLAIGFGQRARVNGIAPGLIMPTDEYSDAQIAEITDMMPLRILPDPSNIAEAVLYLAKARSVTGQMIFVDAGAHLKSYPKDFVFLGK